MQAGYGTTAPTSPTTVAATTAQTDHHEKSAGEKVKEKIPGTQEHKAKKAEEMATDTHGEQGRTAGTAIHDTFTKDQYGRSDGQAFKETLGTGAGAGTGTGHTVEEGRHMQGRDHLINGSTIDTRGPGIGGSHGPPGAAEKIKERLPGTHEHKAMKAMKAGENLSGTGQCGTMNMGDTLTTDAHGRPEARTDRNTTQTTGTHTTGTHTTGSGQV